MFLGPEFQFLPITIRHEKGAWISRIAFELELRQSSEGDPAIPDFNNIIIKYRHERNIIIA